LLFAITFLMVDSALDSCGFILLVFGFLFFFQSDFGASISDHSKASQRRCHDLATPHPPRPLLVPAGRAGRRRRCCCRGRAGRSRAAAPIAVSASAASGGSSVPRRRQPPSSIPYSSTPFASHYMLDGLCLIFLLCLIRILLMLSFSFALS
jgi:hypothetical protein